MLLLLIYQWILPRTQVLLRICCRERMRRMGAFYESSQPLKFSTANGNIFGTGQANVKIRQTDSIVRPYVLDETPAVLPVGMRCLKDGYDFVWRAHTADLISDCRMVHASSLRSRTTCHSFLLRPKMLFQPCRRTFRKSQPCHQLLLKLRMRF